jgi:hypothetical protein
MINSEYYISYSQLICYILNNLVSTFEGQYLDDAR